MSPLHGAYTPGAPARNGPFIILEGISGIGKSTLARTLAARLNAGSLHTVPDFYMPWAPVMNARTRALPQFAFYLSGVLHASDIIRRELAAGPVVSDRYISSVLAYHSAVHELGLRQVAELLAPFRPYLLAPDRTFYLRCTDQTLRERMSRKQDFNEDDDAMMNVPGRLARLRENFDKVAADDPTGVILDTDDRTPSELADTITEYLMEAST
ncbi:AAA family ATPase [Streptomyces sp. NPDC057245]|uniref:dTMP kinase n=1 Tax=Streptomyces TaxID=1883 RepID=UPI001C1E1486|nr:AAA family ATPase [Streptomyces sp. A108]MBU6536367.1 AAA family ATPase [Streptomyces sp. A108]